MKKVLTIAGSDSSAGAGIQADLKTFAARGVYGMSAITALTAQNTTGVQGVWDIPAEFVGQQIDSVMTDIGADAWKLGMLSNAEIITRVADRARHYGVDLLVLDPVMVAKGGDPLLRPEARDALIEQLLPLAYLVTPNYHEAQVLSGQDITSFETMRQAAIAIAASGPRHVLVKGGDMPGASAESVDLLYDGQKFAEFRAPRVNSKHTHGTGCTLAAAIAAELALGQSIHDAVSNAKAYVTAAIEAGVHLGIGRGQGPLDHFPQQTRAYSLEPKSGN
jgi:hydroxymethylpyrimidine/phosphomethylpyrimidine kinase